MSDDPIPRRKLRIVTLYRTLGVGGDENRLLNFVRGFDRSRFELTLVVVFPATESQLKETEQTMLAEFIDAGIEVIFLDDAPERWTKPWLRPTIFKAVWQLVHRLVQLLRDKKADVLDCRLPPAIPLGVIAATLARTPVITAAQYGLYCVKTAPQRLLAQLTWPCLDALVCDSEMRLQEILQSIRFAPPKGVYIPNGIFQPKNSQTAAETRARLGLPAGDALVIGQVASLFRSKGFGILLEAAALCLRSQPNLEFLFCGFEREPGLRNELLSRARELGIAERITIAHYNGPIGDIWEIIDIHAHASLVDSAPQTIVESMSFGKPAVVTAVGGIPEMVESGRSAIMVPPGRHDLFADALLQVVRDSDLRAALGSAARARYEQLYRAERMVGEIEALFESLVHPGKQYLAGPAVQETGA